MSSPARTALRGAVGLATALVAVTACTSDKRAPPGDGPSGVWPLATAGAAGQSSTDPLSPTAGPVSGVGQPGAGTTPVPDLAAPRKVATLAATTVCNFDWHQTLAQRVAAIRHYATPAYAQALEPSSGDVANWRSTQRDREIGTCTEPTATLVRTAPNAPTVYFERVRMQQKLALPKKQPTTQTFEVLYRVEKQYDGRWLVGAEGDGG
jgi:hypothetical protein